MNIFYFKLSEIGNLCIYAITQNIHTHTHTHSINLKMKALSNYWERRWLRWPENFVWLSVRIIYHFKNHTKKLIKSFGRNTFWVILASIIVKMHNYNVLYLNFPAWFTSGKVRKIYQPLFRTYVFLHGPSLLGCHVLQRNLAPSTLQWRWTSWKDVNPEMFNFVGTAVRTSNLEMYFL